MFKNQTQYYKGKVRDVFTIQDNILVMVASNRISAFDCILPKEIPYKGQVLNHMAKYFLDATRDIVENWLIDTPISNVSVGLKCIPIPIEIVVRGNLTGHALRMYNAGERTLCGIQLDEGLKANQFFENPIITPTTKANEGHDEDISKQEILSRGIVSESDFNTIERISLQLFERGKDMAKKMGLILVDTKYEFGKIGDKLVLMDEIHTPDSSRYFEIENFEEAFKSNTSPVQLSKEFVREWLMANGFQGKEGQAMPIMPDELVNEISEKYIHLFERITGKTFIKDEPFDESKSHLIDNFLQKLVF